MASSVALSRLDMSNNMFIRVSIWLKSGAWPSAGSSSVTDSSGSCVSGTDTCFHHTEFLASLYGEAERVTPLVFFPLTFGLGGTVKVKK